MNKKRNPQKDNPPVTYIREPGGGDNYILILLMILYIALLIIKELK